MKKTVSIFVLLTFISLKTLPDKRQIDGIPPFKKIKKDHTINKNDLALVRAANKVKELTSKRNSLIEFYRYQEPTVESQTTINMLEAQIDSWEKECRILSRPFRY